MRFYSKPPHHLRPIRPFVDAKALSPHSLASHQHRHSQNVTADPQIHSSNVTSDPNGNILNITPTNSEHALDHRNSSSSVIVENPDSLSAPESSSSSSKAPCSELGVGSRLNSTPQQQLFPSIPPTPPASPQRFEQPPFANPLLFSLLRTRPFYLTLLVAGESGLGKSTLIDSLFLTDIYAADATSKLKGSQL